MRADAQAVLAARHELGPDYDEHLADSFADRIEAEVARRVRQRGAEQPVMKSGDRIGMFAITMGLGIPLTAIAAGTAGVTGLVVAWAGMIGCNVAASHRPRDHRRR